MKYCQIKPVKSLTGFISLIALMSCSPDYSKLATFQPEHIRCSDHSTPEILQRAEYDFGQMASSAPNVDERHVPELTRKLIYQSLQSSKKLADSGNVIGMDIFGDMMEHELVISYLDKKHIFTSNEAAAVKLPETMHQDVVAALSYVYVAIATKNDAGVRAQKVIDRLRTPANVDGSSVTDYLPIPETWFEEAKTNADHWKAYCAQE